MAGRRRSVAHRPSRLVTLLTGLGLLAGAVVGGLVTATASTAVEITPTPASGVWTVDGHGNGHGHGLSQYGARGAAIAGLSYDKILAFYYPGTTLAVGSAVPITVLISSTGTQPAVSAEAGLTVTGVAGALPTAGIDQYRADPIRGGLPAVAARERELARLEEHRGRQAGLPGNRRHGHPAAQFRGGRLSRDDLGDQPGEHRDRGEQRQPG